MKQAHVSIFLHQQTGVGNWAEKLVGNIVPERFQYGADSTMFPPL